MSEKDEVKELADKMGGWENLARGLHQLYTAGKKTMLVAFHNRAETLRISKVFFPVKRGAKMKRDLQWFWMVEDILDKAKVENPHNREESIIEKNLNEIYGERLNGKKERDAANKTVRNTLAKHRALNKKISAARNEFFFEWGDEPPVGYDHIDDPRLLD